MMMASSSRTRSRASAALLGDSSDSWEWDSLKLCINRVLGGKKEKMKKQQKEEKKRGEDGGGEGEKQEEEADGQEKKE